MKFSVGRPINGGWMKKYICFTDCVRGRMWQGEAGSCAGKHHMEGLSSYLQVGSAKGFLVSVEPHVTLFADGQELSWLSSTGAWEVFCLPGEPLANTPPSLTPLRTAMEPTWEAATPFGAVVGAGGAEILWLVVWQSISQSLSHPVVRDVKQG